MERWNQRRQQVTRLVDAAVGCAIVFLSFLYLALLLSGCATTRTIVEQPVIQHTAELAQLEDGIRDYGRTIESVVTDLEAVRERAAAAGGTIKETIILFDAYQRAVERLIQDYNRLRTQAENAKAISVSPDSDPDG